MKKSVLAIVLSVVTLFALEAHNVPRKSKLNLKLWDNSFFSVELNHKVYPRQVREFKANNLQPGRHYVKVIKKVQRPNGFLARVIFQGYVTIPSNSRVTAKISRNHRFDVLKVRSLSPRHGHHVHNSHGHNNHGTMVNSHSGGGINSHAGASYNDALIMSDFYFGELRNTIKNTAFDSDKIKVARQAIRHSFVSSEQVLALMKMFSFDSYRVELAKFAYAYTLDKQNYFIVNNAFSFSSSVSELNQYIQTYPI